MASPRVRAAAALSWLGRRYPLYRGHGWLSHHLLPLPHVGAHGAATEVRLRLGPRMLVHTDEYIGRIVFYFGELDPRISWVCRHLLRPDDVVVDIGANYGVVSLLAADLVGDGGVVHAVEPQPEVAALLRQSKDRNSFRQLHLHELALSDADGTLELRIPTGNLGGASLSRRAEQGSSVAVEVRHSGTFLAELGISSIRMLKLDIEGHEAQFLRGAHQFLLGCSPDVIVFESNEALYDKKDEHVLFWDRPAVRQMRALGYEMVRIGDSRGAVAPKLTAVERRGDDRGLDFVAIHREKYPEIARLLGVS